MGVLDRLQRLDDRLLPFGRLMRRLQAPADRDALAIWERLDDAERLNVRRMAVWRNVADEPELALVVAGLIDRVLEERARQSTWAWVAFGSIFVVLVVLAAGLGAGASSFSGGGAMLGAVIGWLLQVDLYDRARRRNLEHARAGGLR